jgi:hypothetical protein
MAISLWWDKGKNGALIDPVMWGIFTRDNHPEVRHCHLMANGRI